MATWAKLFTIRVTWFQHLKGILFGISVRLTG